MASEDNLDMQAARTCLAQYQQLSARHDAESADEANQCMVDANCCIQAIVLRGNIKANPFNASDEKELFESFKNEMLTVGLPQ